MVYFITDSEFIKIGYTKKAAEVRLSGLQTGNPKPLTLLGTIDGGCDMESHLHTQFAQERCGGEWFKPSPRLIHYLATYLDSSIDLHKIQSCSNYTPSEMYSSRLESAPKPTPVVSADNSENIRLAKLFTEEVCQKAAEPHNESYVEFAGNGAKYDLLLNQVAHMLHLLNGGGDNQPINANTTDLAETWLAYLQPHALQVQDASDAESKLARKLDKLIANGTIYDGMTFSQAYRKLKANTPREQLEPTFTALADRNILRIEKESKQGRGKPRELLRLHPELRQAK